MLKSTASCGDPAPLVSVIIPAYNSLAWLEGAIQSVEAQEVRECEILLVDDGSTDGTPDWAARQGDRFRYYRQMNRGPAAARNLAADLAKGQYLAFLDADDLWLSGKLDRQLEALDSAPDCSFVFCDGYRLVSAATNLPPGDLSPSCGRLSSLYAHPPDRLTIEMEFRIHCVPTSSVLLRRKDYLWAGGMRSLYRGEDYVLFCLLLAQNPAVFIDEPLFFYRVHSDNASAKVRNRRQAWANIQAMDRARLAFACLSDELGIMPEIAFRYTQTPVLGRFLLLLWWRLTLGSSKQKVLRDILRYLSA